MSFIILIILVFALAALIGLFRQPIASQNAEQIIRLKRENRSLRQDVQRMRERIRTLEAIVTDPDEILRRNFRGL